MLDKQQVFQQILDANVEFAQAKDVDFLLEKILTTVRRLSHADVGTIYLIEGDELRLHHTQNGKQLPNNALPHIYRASAGSIPQDTIPAYVAQTGEIVNITSPLIDREPANRPDRSYEQELQVEILSIFAFPLKNTYEKLIGVIQLINIHSPDGKIAAVPEDDLPLVQLFANNAGAALERALATRARLQGIIQILTALRDTEETFAHVNRVGAYAAEIYDTWARRKGISEYDISGQKDALRMAAMLHDLGKLAIPSVIRKKPGKLTEEEYNTMKEHTIKGAQLLLKHGNSDIESLASEIALTHHERWDGKGYPGYIDPQTGESLPDHCDEQGRPLGKHGENIPVFGRIVAIADVYDALSNHRVFREAWKEEDVLKKLRVESGTHFDPEMIDAFFACLETIRAISRRFPD